MAWRIRIRLPSSTLVLSEGISSDTKFAAFKEALWEAAGIAPPEDGEEEPIILGGFPPRPLTLQDDAPISSALGNNDSVTVQFGSGGDNPQGKGKARSGTHSKAATARKPAKSGIHTLSGPAAKAFSPARPAAARSTGGGDSGGGGGGGASSGDIGGGGGWRRKRPRGGDSLGNETDIASRLLAAVGGGTGTANKAFRGVFRAAVENQWDQSKADARVRAALGGWFSIEDCEGERTLGTGQHTAMRVTFSKGAGQRSNHVEEVECLPTEAITAVVLLVLSGDDDAREMLKPHNMAAYSPRMFWSIVRQYGGNLSRALRELVPAAKMPPGVTWSFLETRERALSAKAKANLETEEMLWREQEEEAAEKAAAVAAVTAAEAAGNIGGPEGGEVAGDATMALEPLLEAAAAEEATAAASDEAAAAAQLSARERAAAAAQARLATGGAGAAATGSTAAASGPAAGDGNGGDDSGEETDTEGVLDIVSDEFMPRLRSAGVLSVERLAAADAGQLAVTARVARERAAGWVREAQEWELDEIMAAIVGDADVVEALQQFANIATPRDLVLRGGSPALLVATVLCEMDPERAAELGGRVTVEAAQRWASDAGARIAATPWLNSWVTAL